MCHRLSHICLERILPTGRLALKKVRQKGRKGIEDKGREFFQHFTPNMLSYTFFYPLIAPQIKKKKFLSFIM